MLGRFSGGQATATGSKEGFSLTLTGLVQTQSCGRPLGLGNLGVTLGTNDYSAADLLRFVREQ